MRKRFLSIGVAASCLLLIGLAVPAVAQEGDVPPDTPVDSQNRGNAQNRSQAATQRARDLVDQVRDRAEARRAQVRADVCERRESQLNQLIPRLSTNATTLLDTMDTLYIRVQQFYTTGQLAVSNYDDLKANVDTAKVEATAAVQALLGYEFDLDCDDPQAGNHLDSFRLATNEAREALRAYRAELVTLIGGLKSAESVDNDESTEGQQ